MLKENDVVYYIIENQLYCGNVIEIETVRDGYLFSIDSYGGCEGPYRIHSDQIGIFVFDNREAAEIHLQ